MTRKPRMPHNPLLEDLAASQAEIDVMLGNNPGRSRVVAAPPEANEPRSESADDECRREALHLLRRRVIAASGAGLIPSPFLDLATIAAIQLELVKALAALYNVSFRESLGKSLLASLTGGALPFLVAPSLCSLLKVVPLVGFPAGALSVSTVGAATTYAVGRVFIMHFSSGGTLLDFDPQAMRSHYRKEFAAAPNVNTKHENRP